MTKKITFFILILVLICLVVFLNYKNFLGGIKNFIFKVLDRIATFFKKIIRSIVNFFKLIFQIRTVEEDNTRLKNENLILVSKLINDEKLLENYALIEKQNSLRGQSRFNYLFADVVGMSSQGVGEFLIINRGKADGIDIGMPVVAGDALVGRIIEVYSNYSKAVMINDSSVKVAIKTSESGAFGVTDGEDGQIFISLISKDQKINEGEIVLSSGKDGAFPANLILGKIEKIYDSDTQLFQKVKVDPLIDYYNQDSVFVITNYLN